MKIEYFENMDRFTNRSMPSEIEPIKAKIDFAGVEKESSQLGLVDLFDFNLNDSQPSEISLPFILSVFSKLGERNSELAFYLTRGFSDHVYRNLLGIDINSETETVRPFCDGSFVFNSDRIVVSLNMCDEVLQISKLKSPEYFSKYSGFLNLEFISSGDFEKISTIPISKEKYLCSLSIHSLVLQSIYVGLMSSSIKYAHRYACSRQAFGKPIINFQAISQKIAQLSIYFEVIKTHIIENTPNCVLDKELVHHALQGEVLCSEMGPDIFQECIQVLGGHGYVADHPLESMFRNSLTLLGFIQTFSEILKGKHERTR